MSVQQKWQHFLILSLCIQLSACGTDSSSGDTGSSLDESIAAQTPVTITQSSSAVARSTISVRLTDAPVDNLLRAVVQFTAVELRRESGGWVRFTLITPRAIDLLKQQGANTAELITNVPVGADTYTEIRLITDGAAMTNFVELALGGIKPLEIPGGSGAGLKLKQDFTVQDQRAANFVIDFDLRQSIKSPDGLSNFKLKPVMRLVSVNGIGHIRGMVSAQLLTAVSCSDALVDTFNSAYVFAGHNVTPDDINQLSDDGVEPVTTSAIRYDSTTFSYIYEAAFLPAGDYTLALTCNADAENLEADDDLLFFGIQNTTVLENNTIFLRIDAI